MEIVAKISDEMFKSLQSGQIQNGSIAAKVILNAVKNGLALPAGHDALLDRTELYDKFDNAGLSWESRIIDSVHPVIPADR